ncbi:MAG: sensor domain-containing diguanylate cyclase [Planctomycetota bacterium]
MLNIEAYPDFESAARAVLSFLHGRLGFDLWMVTRVEGENWIVLQAEDHGYNVGNGAVFNWTDSFCSQMIQGNGPRVAPSSAKIPAYASAAIGKQVAIGAYIGVPLAKHDGSLFGTLCAIHPSSQPESILNELPMIELFARLLSTILQSSLKETEQSRRAERAEVEAMSDSLTGLYNRRGWDRLMASEESRCIRFGHAAVVLLIDLDGLKQINDSVGHAMGDELLISAAKAIRNAVRTQDVVARLGGDEFAVLGVECNPLTANSLNTRINAALSVAGIRASIGMSMRDHTKSLTIAFERADAEMYRIKKAKGVSPR